ncbi:MULTISPECIES: glutaminase A [Microbulbifer]|uniref:glutaminase A n=1 Tax=Microbulbifer TaxID=48073 RepID=UPI001E5FAD1F|nr:MULTISPECIES: glutaminase A [Microbulbifer]UHQ55712.1 glutaminase A [Microbulbifer sp. YPW16]
MHEPLPPEAQEKTSIISTGSLPAAGTVAAMLHDAYELYRVGDEGRVADYIPVLAEVPRDLFGACITSVDGTQHAEGDADHSFTIQSVSKPFVFALVCQAIGVEEARRKIGVNATGMPYDSVIALELSPDRLTNTMVNAGAIATTSLAPGKTAEEKWRFVLDGLSRFAGRRLEINETAYNSEMATNQRNRGVAKLLEGYERMYCDAMEATDVYTRQCSINVTTRDLAVMSATLAGGGVNPLSGERVVGTAVSKRVLAVLATAGLYELTGDWLYETGLPGKSGVSGGLITVIPGKGGLATFSPPLDDAGNSIKGLQVTRYLSERMALNLFASKPRQ